MTKKSKGLGDSIERITKATGIKAVVDKISEATGIPCNCSERKEALNKLFPYSRQMTADEMKIYKEVLPRVKGEITREDQGIMVKLYNKVFNSNKQPSGCTPCVRETLDKLKKVYDNSCEI